MPSFLRNKTVFSLIALLVLGMVLGSAHNRALETGESFAPSNIVRTVLIPVEATFHRVFAVGEWLLRFVRPRSAILRENAALRREVKRLTEENARLREAAEENVRLRQALHLRLSLPFEMVPAEIIARSGSGWFDTATIDRGRKSGIKKGDAVICVRGLVGQVVEADAFTSQVVALTDQSSAVGALVQRSRQAGIIQGQGPDLLVLSYLPKDADVREKDIVVSSGMGRVIPKGLPIGRVVEVIRDSIGGTTSALVKPSARLDNTEQVFVIKTGQTVPVN